MMKVMGALGFVGERLLRNFCLFSGVNLYSKCFVDFFPGAPVKFFLHFLSPITVWAGRFIYLNTRGE